jgi:hypothetical protein
MVDLVGIATTFPARRDALNHLHAELVSIPESNDVTSSSLTVVRGIALESTYRTPPDRRASKARARVLTLSVPAGVLPGEQAHWQRSQCRTFACFHFVGCKQQALAENLVDLVGIEPDQIIDNT